MAGPCPGRALGSTVWRYCHVVRLCARAGPDDSGAQRRRADGRGRGRQERAGARPGARADAAGVPCQGLARADRGWWTRSVPTPCARKVPACRDHHPSRPVRAGRLPGPALDPAAADGLRAHLDGPLPPGAARADPGARGHHLDRPAHRDRLPAGPRRRAAARRPRLRPARTAPHPADRRRRLCAHLDPVRAEPQHRGAGRGPLRAGPRRRRRHRHRPGRGARHLRRSRADLLLRPPRGRRAHRRDRRPDDRRAAEHVHGLARPVRIPRRGGSRAAAHVRDDVHRDAPARAPHRGRAAPHRRRAARAGRGSGVRRRSPLPGLRLRGDLLLSRRIHLRAPGDLRPVPAVVRGRVRPELRRRGALRLAGRPHRRAVERARRAVPRDRTDGRRMPGPAPDGTRADAARGGDRLAVPARLGGAVLVPRGHHARAVRVPADGRHSRLDPRHRPLRPRRARRPLRGDRRFAEHPAAGGDHHRCRGARRGRFAADAAPSRPESVVHAATA